MLMVMSQTCWGPADSLARSTRHSSPFLPEKEIVEICLGPPTVEGKICKNNAIFLCPQLFGPPWMSLVLRPWSPQSSILRTRLKALTLIGREGQVLYRRNGGVGGVVSNRLRIATIMWSRDATLKKMRQTVPVVGWGAKLWFSARDDIIKLILTCVHLGHDFILLLEYDVSHGHFRQVITNLLWNVNT